MKPRIIAPRRDGFYPLAQPTPAIPARKAGGRARTWTQFELLASVAFQQEHLNMVRTQVALLGRPETYEGERAATLSSAIKHLTFLQLAAGELAAELTRQQSQPIEERNPNEPSKHYRPGQ